MIGEFSVRTRSRNDAVDITSEVQNIVSRSGVSEGICVIYVPHTTAGVTINEGADPAVMQDVLESLEKLVPWRAGYKHLEGNSAAHIKASLVGSSVQIIIDNGKLSLGTWQRVFFCEFDGPRTRRVKVMVS
ncbi:MAG: YjbQ family protein [Deltaproteobacteria bacterium]|nr:YjbQ family protein [Deltaproteobacteria bacterium]MBW2069022.1 YjbQ family protein [Deltaproteobacteria bacterium]